MDGLIHALIVFVILDQITGTLAGVVKHELSSNKGFKGIARKITIFLLVGMVHIVGKELLGDTTMLRNVVITFYLVNEGLSIVENAIIIGIPVPEIIKAKLLEITKIKFNTNDKQNNRTVA